MELKEIINKVLENLEISAFGNKLEIEFIRVYKNVVMVKLKDLPNFCSQELRYFSKETGDEICIYDINTDELKEFEEYRIPEFNDWRN